MLSREEIVEATRAFVRSELVRDADAPLGETEGLISGGIVTSFDLVSLTVFLEERFSIKVPDARVSREHLDTLDQIASLVLELRGEGTVGATPLARGRDPVARLVPSFRRAPLVALLAMLALAACTDRVLARLLAREDVLTRLERPSMPDRKRLSYVYPSYSRALARHELALTPKAKDEIRVVFQGDSGTYGSFLDADEACGAVAGKILAAKDPGVRVYNVSYFGQTFVKDAEMLEADLAYSPDLVLVSFSSTHLERTRNVEWWLKPATTMVYNRPLFTRFLEHVPRSAELEDYDGILAESEARNGMGLRHRVERVSATVENQLLLQGALVDLLPGALTPAARARKKSLDPETTRVFRGVTARENPAPFTLDERAIVLLEAVIDRARAGGAEVVLFREPEATLPGEPARRIPWDEKGWKTIAEAVRTLALRKKVTLVDCLDDLAPEDFLDSERHWTREGNAKLGRAIGAELEPVIAKLRKRR